MKFEYRGKQYDLRLKARYLPKELGDIGPMDLVLFLSSYADKRLKQRILDDYLPTAIVL